MVWAEFSWLRIVSIGGLLRIRNSALHLYKMHRLVSSAKGLLPSQIISPMQLRTANCVQSHAMCWKLYLWLQKMKTIVCYCWTMYDKICALLGYYAAYSGNSLPTFRDNLSDTSSRVKKSITLHSPTTFFKGEEIQIFHFSTLENGTNRLSRNVGKELPIYAA